MTATPTPKERFMKTRKKTTLVGSALPKAAANRAMGELVGTTSRSDDSAAGRLGGAMRDSRSTDSSSAAPRARKTNAPALAPFENEVGSIAAVAVRAGSSKKSPATKSVGGTQAQRAKPAVKPNDDSGPPSRATQKAPDNAGRLDEDRSRRQKAESRVNSSQIKRAGLESRVLGHVIARGKRAQARRDSKN